MTFSKKGVVTDCVELPQYQDSKTKELGKKQFAVMLLISTKMKNGNLRKDLIDIKIDESKFKEYHSKIGKEETIEFSLYSKSPISLTEV